MVHLLMFASGGSAIDIEDGLGLADDATNFFCAALEHVRPARAGSVLGRR